MIVDVSTGLDFATRPPATALTPFQIFCIRWSVFFDKTTDALSPAETVLRTIQMSIMVITGLMTMTLVLFADNKKAIESSTYFIICVFMLAISVFAIRTKRFNRHMLLMIEEEFPSYDRPLPDVLCRKINDIRTSYNDFTKRVILSYIALVVFEIQATALVPLTAAKYVPVKLGTQPTQMVVMWFPGDTTQVKCLCIQRKNVILTGFIENRYDIPSFFQNRF